MTPFKPARSLEQEITTINSVFDAGRLPGVRDQWESWCRRLWDAAPLEVSRFRHEMVEGGHFLSLEFVEEWVRQREQRAAAKPTIRYFKVSPRGFGNEVIYFRVQEHEVAEVNAVYDGFEDTANGEFCGWTDDARARAPGVAVDWADRAHIGFFEVVA